MYGTEAPSSSTNMPSYSSRLSGSICVAEAGGFLSFRSFFLALIVVSAPNLMSALWLTCAESSEGRTRRSMIFGMLAAALSSVQGARLESAFWVDIGPIRSRTCCARDWDWSAGTPLLSRIVMSCCVISEMLGPSPKNSGLVVRDCRSWKWRLRISEGCS